MNVDFFHPSETFFPMDKSGYLQPPLKDIQTVSELNRSVLKEVLRICLEIIQGGPENIFFRGSQVLNEYVSDFDLVIVVGKHYNIQSQELSNILTSSLCGRFTHIKNFDAFVCKETDIPNNRRLQFILKVLSVRYYGKNIEDSFAGFRPNLEIAFTLKDIDKKLSAIRSQLNGIPRNELMNLTNHLIKMLIRASFELVIEQEKRYTRELGLCHSIFCNYYPEYRQISQDFLSKYNRPNIEIHSFMAECSDFAKLLNLEKELLLKSIAQ